MDQAQCPPHGPLKGLNDKEQQLDQTGRWHHIASW